MIPPYYLGDYLMDQDIFVKHVQDVYRLCEKYRSPRFSKFLDERGQAEILKSPMGSSMLFGGYEGAEWKMFGAFPSFDDMTPEAFPIKVLDIRKKYGANLGHRNYLGTILSLGIDRNKIGDILFISLRRRKRTHKKSVYLRRWYISPR